MALFPSPRFEPRRRIMGFASDERGNIAILFAFMVGIVLLLAGGAVDYVRHNIVRADMVQALEAAGLAIAQYDDAGGAELANLNDAQRDQKLKEFGEAVFFENFSFEGSIENLDVDFVLNAQVIRPSATGRIKTLLLHAGEVAQFGHQANDLKFLDLSESIEITRRGSGRVELALVLDVTGSMGGSSGGVRKIDSLKAATENLLQVMYGNDDDSDFVKIGVVPFNAFVNPGGAASWSSSWSDEEAEAVYHGARFIHVDGTGDMNGDGSPDIDPKSSIQVKGKEFKNGVARVIDVTRKVNHFDLYESLDETDWFGCVEARPYPLDELDIPPGTAVAETVISGAYANLTSIDEPNSRVRLAFDRAPDPVLSDDILTMEENSYWVPLFHPDEPDCTNQGSGNCFGDWNWRTSQYMLGATSRSIRNRGNMFDNPDGYDYNDSAYENEQFAEDYVYAYYNGNQSSFGRYLEVVIGMRYATKAKYNQLDDYWDGVKDRLKELEVKKAGSDEYKLRIAYPGWWDQGQQRYRGRYDNTVSLDINEPNSPGYSATRGPSRGCPTPILPLTNNRNAVETYVNTLQPSGNTNSANGAVWGWRLLSPEPPFIEGVSYDDGQWQKAVVIMTDGVNVASEADTHWESKNTAYGFALEERMGQGVNKPGRGGGGFDSDRMADHIDEKLLRVCRRMKKKGILVYTIVFGLNDSNLEEVFEACASPETSTSKYYYKAPTGADLETAFGDIAADLVKLHVSG